MATLGLQCQADLAGGGSSSETTNGAVIAGHVLNPDSTPVAGALVQLRPATYLADTSTYLGKARAAMLLAGNTTTDSSGLFVFDSVDINRLYRIAALDSEESTGTGEELNNGGPDTTWVSLPFAEPTGSIWGYVKVADVPARAWVRIYGLERIASSDSATGAFRFDGLPAGRYKVQAWRTPADTCTLSEHDSVQVFADSVHFVDDLELCDH
jgi:hypothetical protein